MRKLTILFIAAILLATPALAAEIYTYDWADGNADFLGCFDFDATAEASTAYNRPGSTGSGIQITKAVSGGGYALGFLAAVWGLEAGDEVTVSMWRYDNASGLPYFRLWAHYNNMLTEAGDARGQDMQINDGDCYGNNDFGLQSGWERFSHTWTVEAGNSGMIIDAVVYGDRHDYIYVDDLAITVPDHASVRLPNAIYPAGGIPTATEVSTWSAIKAIFE